jgi:hypothetical protein
MLEVERKELFFWFVMIAAPVSGCFRLKGVAAPR